MRIALALLICALGVSARAEEPAPAGRFSLVPVAGGALRLDTQTGEIALCADANGTLACRIVQNAASATAAGVPSDRIAALEARIAALEARAATSAPALTEEETIDRVGDLAEKMMRRFFGIVRDLRRDMDGEQL